MSFFLSSLSSIYSIIFSFGLNGFRSSRPIDFTAILSNSFSETPTERLCFLRKYFPASSIACKGINPTNSEPVTLIPLSSAFLNVSSKAIWTGVILIFVKFIEIWAIPYSSINQPIPLTHFNDPGIITVLPFFSLTILPVTGSPSLLALPRSRTSNATEFALRAEVVFKFTLNATRKSRAPTAVTPILGLNRAGPKSGFQCGSASFLGMPSYSPERQFARFRLSSVKAAFS